MSLHNTPKVTEILSRRPEFKLIADFNNDTLEHKTTLTGSPITFDIEDKDRKYGKSSVRNRNSQ